MRVLYGITRKPSKKPLAIIFQRFRSVHDPIEMKNYSIIHEREAIDKESWYIFEKMQLPNRIYRFANVEEMVNSESKNLVITPQVVQDNLHTYENRHVRKAD